jgi:hypothetical protein
MEPTPAPTPVSTPASPPIPPTLRVYVKGASTVVWMSWMGGPRTDFAFPRVIETELQAGGRPAEVQVNALPAEVVRHALRTWEQEIVGWSPDVVILHYGHMETIHLFLPRWLERHANSVKGRPHKLRMLYRKKLLEPAWQTLAHLQCALDKRLPPTMLAFRPRRAAADLERLIQKIRQVGSPLVLVPNILPAGPPYKKWFPGIDARIVAMNEAIADMVRRMDQPDVRVFRVDEVVEPLLAEGENAQPDGGHYTPEIHRAVGEAMTRVISDWADTQPHLKRG